jgi:hypothetical protein
MRIKQIQLYLILPFILFGCNGSKSGVTIKRDYSFSTRIPYKKCDDPIKLNEDLSTNSLKNFDNLSFSAAYTSIDTYHSAVSDTIAKDSIRYLYAKNIKDLVKLSFPNIEMLNDSMILKKDNPFILKNTGNIWYRNRNLNSSITKLIQESYQSNKQLFIEISSYYYQKQFNNRINIFVFNTTENKLLYLNKLNYICDIRDYESLEKAISYGLLKLKENFE